MTSKNAVLGFSPSFQRGIGGVLRSALFALVGISVISARAGVPLEEKPLERPESLLGFPLVVESYAEVDFLQDSPSVPSGLLRRAKLSLPLFYPVWSNVRLLGSLSAKVSDYESAPFDKDGLTLWDLSATALANVDFNKQWSATVGVLGSASFEEGADISESINGGALAMVGYRWSDTLQTSIGGLYLSRTGEDPLVVPAIGVEYQPCKAFQFSIRGLQARAQWLVSDRWEGFWRAEWNPFGPRLRPRSNTAALSFQDNSTRTGLGIAFHPRKSWTVSLESGVVFHKIESHDADRNVVGKDTLDPAAYIGAHVTAQF
jgi:hypothetical protein